MAKISYVLMLLLSAFVHAAIPTQLATADAFKRALEQFKPSEIMKGYTESPAETRLNPTESNDDLKNQGLSATNQNETANLVYTESHTRTKAIKNLNSAEMQYAEKLIEGSSNVNESGCYAQPPKCTTNTTSKTCMDTLNYKAVNCHDTLTVTMKKTVHAVKRMIVSNNLKMPPLDLEHCRPNEQRCTSSDEIHTDPNCLAVSIVATWKGQKLETSTDQTCNSLILTNYSDIKSLFIWADITVTEYSSNDVWDKSACRALQEKASTGGCIFQKGEPCLESNATKIIEGIPVKRACWGSAMDYQCFDHIESACSAWIDNPACAQTLSTCVSKDFGVCTQYSQTFECALQTCIPQPDICMPDLHCMNGECDSTKNEESHDMGEGVSKLGALIGVASDVSTNQIDRGMANIFAGNSMECEKHMLGSRNCCSDSGWADWVMHCPKNMQDLHMAKEEGRAIYVGEYDDGLFDSDKHYVYCIFPSKLSGIIQIEGRGAQLHIPFGTAKHPACSGITPEQLERINFGSLNLSPIEKELMSRIDVPDLGVAANRNQMHIEQLNLAGSPHD